MEGAQQQYGSVERMVRFVRARTAVFEVRRCEYSRPDPSDDGGPCDAHMPRNRQFCRCGAKAMCFFKDPAQQAWSMTRKQLLDAMVSDLEHRRMMTDGRLGEVFRKFVALCQAALSAYGKDVLLAVKGGNAFAAHFSSLFGKHTRACEQWASIGDLDFEVHLDSPTPARVREACKVVTAVLYFVRAWLLQQEQSAPVVEGDAAMRELLGASSSQEVRLHPDGRASDNVVILKAPESVDDRGEECRRDCAMLYMPVPCVLRYRDRARSEGSQWLMPSGGNTNYPISYNQSLNGEDRSDVTLLRLRRAARVAVGSDCNITAYAEVIDVTVAGERDAKHVLMRQRPGDAVWFEEVAGFRVLSLYGLYHDLVITLFLDAARPYPWTVYKYTKRVGRLLWVCAMMSLTGVDADGRRCPPRTVTDAAADIRRLASSPMAGRGRLHWALAETSARLKTFYPAKEEGARAFLAAFVETCGAVAAALEGMEDATVVRGISEDNALVRAVGRPHIKAGKRRGKSRRKGKKPS
jgi:hypothetical protein